MNDAIRVALQLVEFGTKHIIKRIEIWDEKEVAVNDGTARFNGEVYESADDPEYYLVFPANECKFSNRNLRKLMKNLMDHSEGSVGFCSIKDLPENLNFHQDNLERETTKILIYKRSRFEDTEYFPISRYFEFTEKRSRELLRDALVMCRGLKSFSLVSRFYRLTDQKAGAKVAGGVQVAAEAQALLFVTAGGTMPSGEVVAEGKMEKRDEEEEIFAFRSDELPPLKGTICKSPNLLHTKYQTVLQLFGIKGILERNTGKVPQTPKIETYSWIKMTKSDIKIIKLQGELGVFDDFVNAFAKVGGFSNKLEDVGKLLHLKCVFYEESEFIDIKKELLEKSEYESPSLGTVKNYLNGFCASNNRRSFVIHLCGTQNVGKSSFIYTSELAMMHKIIAFRPQDVPSMFPLELRNSVIRDEKRIRADGTKYFEEDHFFNNYTVYEIDHESNRILMNDTMGIDVNGGPLSGFEQLLKDFTNCIFEGDGKRVEKAIKKKTIPQGIIKRFQDFMDFRAEPSAYIIMGDIDVLHQRISSEYRIWDDEPAVPFNEKTKVGDLERLAGNHKDSAQLLYQDLERKMFKGDREIDALFNMVNTIEKTGRPYVVLLNKRDIIDHQKENADRICGRVEAIIESLDTEKYDSDNKKELHDCVQVVIDRTIKSKRANKPKVFPHSCCRTTRIDTINNLINCKFRESSLDAERERIRLIYESTISIIRELMAPYAKT